jgi:hypothetical protein
MNTHIAKITEYWLDGSVHVYEMARDEVRLHCPQLGARVTVMFPPGYTAPRPRSLIQEQYEAAWRLKKSLR